MVQLKEVKVNCLITGIVPGPPADYLKVSWSRFNKTSVMWGQSQIHVHTHTHTHTHTQMLAHIGLLLHVLLLLPMGSFLPLFCSSPAEIKKKKKSHLHYFYVEQNFIVSIMPAWEFLSPRKYKCKKCDFKSTFSFSEHILSYQRRDLVDALTYRKWSR